MKNKNTMKILALIALMIYVVSPADLLPGPVDDALLCLLYTFINYRNSHILPGDDTADEKGVV